MKIADERETQKDKQRQKRARGDSSKVVKEWVVNAFVGHLS